MWVEELVVKLPRPREACFLLTVSLRLGCLPDGCAITLLRVPTSTAGFLLCVE